MNAQQIKDQKGYRVHLYAVVRVAVDVPNATSQLDAIKKAEDAVDLAQEFRRGEFADEVMGILVDEMGDTEHLHSQEYKVDGTTGNWVADPQDSPGIESAVVEEEPEGDAPRG